MKGEERKEFLKEYKMSLISGSILTISPSLAGILLWDRLPEKIATHFDQHNLANGWSSKPMAVFGIPFLLLLIHLFCVFFTANDPKRKNINRRIFTMVLWLVPVVSVITCMSIYGLALGMDIDIGVIVNIMVGIMFIILGNYVHKVKQNYTVGMKLPWTLNSEENWNRTNQPYDRLDTDPVRAAFSYEFAAPENGNCFCGNFAGHPCANDLFIYSL